MLFAKQTIITLIVVFYTQLLTGQTTFSPGDIPKVVPPSPNASAIEKFGSIPVDYSTGIPGISYPVWTWSRGKLSFNVGLSYHAGGHRVEDMASNVGLGWALNAGGRISRTVKGLNDDKPIYGFMYNSFVPNTETYAYDGGYLAINGFTPDGNIPNKIISSGDAPGARFQFLKDIANSVVDGEQDLFSINIQGKSCRFVIDRQHTIHTLEHTNLKIQMETYPLSSTNGTGGGIKSFSVTDDNGLVYTFDKQELQSTETVSDANTIPPPPALYYISGWLLTQITDPGTNDKIIIDYTSTDKSYETGFSQSQTIPVGSGGFGIPENYFSYTQVAIAEPVISTVHLPDGSAVYFDYNFARADLSGDKALSAIIAKNANDEVVKSFRFTYAYFISAADWMSTITYNGNDYEKRLKLEKIEELSTDGLLIKPTTFTYNSAKLNRRDSRNIDYWGYNVNPARDNKELMPAIPCPDGYPYNLYLPGADKRPDADFGKACLLEKIEYPTGGYTTFEYESNRAFSDINYYEDKITTPAIEWVHPFGSYAAIVFPGRINTQVEFYFKAEEFNPRPPNPPGGNQSCIVGAGDESAQDGQVAEFQIVDAANPANIIASYSNTYANFLSGTKKVFDLPLNLSYRVRFIYDASNPCYYEFPFKMTASATYYIPLQDKLAGGVRIKKIISNPGNGNSVIKLYEYNKLNGNSSATLKNLPNFDYYKSTVEMSALHGSQPSLSYYINRSSNPVFALDIHNGAPLVYTRVTEKEVDGAETVREYDPLYTGWALGFYPYRPVQQLPQLSGLLLKESIKDRFGTLKSEKNISYQKNLSFLSGDDNINVKSGRIASAAYYSAEGYVSVYYTYQGGEALDTATTTKLYNANGTLQETVTKTYDPVTHYVSAVTATNSKGTETTEEYFHPAMPYMIAHNIIAPVTGTHKYKTGVAGGNISSQRITYSLFTNTLPLPAFAESSVGNNPLYNVLTYDAYDNNGNLLQFTARNGIKNAFLWGYNSTYPVAKIAGKSYEEAITQSGISLTVINNPSTSDAAMRAELNKLRLPGDKVMVSTMTYKPLVGVTSETDANGRTTFYEYDNFNRLRLVRDKDNNIVKKLCYNYQGQQTECSESISLPQPQYCAVCPGNGSGGIKCVNNVCETGVKHLISSQRLGNVWTCTFKYVWSDGSESSPFTETHNNQQCN